ncbi:hypothetical protein M3650_03065 [Paenibacillus sp. MER TA 81-3]|uniref:DUF6886 family protein n=1 Tax=Paenibacillus sp. MER TA 81-3 TaxID=2939573 RepID=UPI00203CFE33|nr:DUF6886 family protein [Paenibacillus sp. MER TA 81-3]MCM3337646.1 hypothetical protein [Paenibacillus sp. MER TA 81-3]
MLYHFSEEPDIEIFKPRPPTSFPQYPPMVFAIDEASAVHYFFPRDCPRVIYWKAAWSTEEDRDFFFANTTVNKIIVVENGWLERIRSTKLYVYTFPAEKFQLFEEAKTAGYYTAAEEIVPLQVEPVGDLLERIASQHVELRFTPDLHPIRNSVIASTLDFSIIRFKHAAKANATIEHRREHYG